MIIDRDINGFFWQDTFVLSYKDYQEMLDYLEVKGIDTYKGFRVVASVIVPERKVYLMDYKELENATSDLDFIKSFFNL